MVYVAVSLGVEMDRRRGPPALLPLLWPPRPARLLSQPSLAWPRLKRTVDLWRVHRVGGDHPSPITQGALRGMHRGCG